MDPSKIEAARAAIREAETELRRSVEASARGARAEKVEVSAEIRAALARLREARAVLDPLEPPDARTNLERARADLAAAEADLDRLLSTKQLSERADKEWISETLQSACDRLSAVQKRLESLERALDDDP